MFRRRDDASGDDYYPTDEASFGQSPRAPINDAGSSRANIRTSSSNPDSSSSSIPARGGVGSSMRQSVGQGANRAYQGSNRVSERVLTVGQDILLKGEIATCDRLVIEGTVDAKLSEVHTVEIAEHGSFSGGANIEDAIISGTFEGSLNVKGRLIIRSTGKVKGEITYGELEIERGGIISGEVTSIDKSLDKDLSSSSLGGSSAFGRNKDNSSSDKGGSSSRNNQTHKKLESA